MLRLIGAIVGGLLLAFAIVFLTDTLFHLLSPGPARPDSNDAEAMRTYVSRLPVAGLFGILLGWALAVYAGAGLAARLALRGDWPGWAVTGLFLLATLGNFLMVPHPTWMILMAIALILVAGALGIRHLGNRSRSVSSEAGESTAAETF